jgi:inositol transport system substrate-binding protein
LEIPGHYFCSQFVARLLRDSGIADLPKSPSLMHPADFLGMEDFETVWDGGMADWVSLLHQYT